MSAFAVKGWCPSTLRPMMSGDGLILRVRPAFGRLTGAQAAGLADLAEQHGNGLIDLSNRANLQLRGLAAESFVQVLEQLAALKLVPREVVRHAHAFADLACPDPADPGPIAAASVEAPAIIVSPFWEAGDDTHALAAALQHRLAAGDLPVLPAKFGFAVDCSDRPVLGAVSADIRIERGIDGGLICRADGLAHGQSVTRETAPGAALELARWFVASGGVSDGRGRMAAHLARHARLLPDCYRQRAGFQPSGAPEPDAGPHAMGFLVGVEFGQLRSRTLRLLAELAPLRLTPWRLLLAEGRGQIPEAEGLLLRPGDPLRRVDACTGAPACAQALAPTRALARQLAPSLADGRQLHVSGCAKGCAHPSPADLTLVACGGGRFNLIRDGNAAGIPVQTGLAPENLIAHPEILYESP